jgi:hypothetical protein
MFCETESEFQIAARTRGAGGVAFRRAPQPSPRISLIHHHLLAQRRLGASERSITPASRILIVTPRLRFPASATKQTLSPISNRYKLPLLHLDAVRPSVENLIENARLKSELSGNFPTVCKFLIENGSGFPIPPRSANPPRYEFHLRISKPPISNLPTARRIRDTCTDIPSLHAFPRCYASCGSRRKSE